MDETVPKADKEIKSIFKTYKSKANGERCTQIQFEGKLYETRKVLLQTGITMVKSTPTEKHRKLTKNHDVCVNVREPEQSC